MDKIHILLYIWGLNYQNHRRDSQKTLHGRKSFQTIMLFPKIRDFCKSWYPLWHFESKDLYLARYSWIKKTLFNVHIYTEYRVFTEPKYLILFGCIMLTQSLILENSIHGCKQCKHNISFFEKGGGWRIYLTWQSVFIW